MNEKKYLSGGDTVKLYCEDGTERKFIIKPDMKPDKRGGSAVCYEARSDLSGWGVLKEFFPINDHEINPEHFVRSDSGQLFFEPDSEAEQTAFSAARSEYLNAYLLLRKAYQSPDGGELSTFLPNFEIFYSDKNGSGSAYIWCPAPLYKPFSELCSEIHEHPENNPENKLATALKAVYNLAQCIQILHRHGFIHRDINPANFGFVKRDGAPLEQAVAIFDVNSIFWQFSRELSQVGTEGYTEFDPPRVPDTGTDIYSIGATLFNAVIISDEARTNGYLFDYERDYERLDELVDGSDLIMASEANSHYRVREAITRVLKKTLGSREGDKRYRRCEDVCADLGEAIDSLLPSNRNAEVLDRHLGENTTTAIQYHLYRHPLYEAIPKEDWESRRDINVLVIGFGKYGQKFLDSCLQAGQIIGKTLNVTVVSRGVPETAAKKSRSKTDKEIYLETRPELAEFFNIDGSLDGSDKQSYGNISFEIKELSKDDISESVNLAENVMYDHFDGKRPDYMFIALGNDLLNRRIALSCKEFVRTYYGDEGNANCCSINYVCEQSGHENKDTGNGVNCVYVYGKISSLDIERMAFNTHLVWEKDLNVDYDNVRKSFKKPYYYNSSISSVLSLKYKLYSIGIELDALGCDGAAAEYNRIKSNDLTDKLMWIEHRRWVTEKLCLGWRSISDLSECLKLCNTRDEKAKRHVCIVRSNPDRNLEKKAAVPSKWDKLSGSDTADFDELDLMSVRLHRVFKEASDSLKRKKADIGKMKSEIDELIGGDRKAEIAFSEWCCCIDGIVNGENIRTSQYNGLKKAFLETLTENLKRDIDDKIVVFDKYFYPVRAACEYRDWKKQDEDFIENIPFILTYSESFCISAPYVVGTNSEIFENVAAATLINPKKIIYLYLVEKHADLKQLEESLPCVIEYMNRKRLRASVDLMLAYGGNVRSYMKDSKISELRSHGGGKLKNIKLCELKDASEFAAEVEKYLKGKKELMLERNSSKLSYMLLGAGLYRKIPSYIFLPEQTKFINISGCEKLGYILKKPHITISEMAAFRLSASEIGAQPDFFENYNELWKTYSNSPADTRRTQNWKQLCNKLSELTAANDVMAVFSLNERDRLKGTAPMRLCYYLSNPCRSGAERLTDLLKEYSLVEQNSIVDDWGEQCYIELWTRLGNERFDSLFSEANIKALTEPKAIDAALKTKREVHIVYDSLVVSGLNLDDFGTYQKPFISRLIDELVNLGCITSAVAPNNTLIISFKSRKYKELLTIAGKMLEVYTYHKLKASGYFDDIISSFEINWMGKEIKNEFDCIATKGFRTIFIECKARGEIDQEFYFKLASLTDQFGINPKPVLIAEIPDGISDELRKLNEMQIERGKMMGITTIFKKEDINNISSVISRLTGAAVKRKEEEKEYV